MARDNVTVLFTGGEDCERQIDKGMIKTIEYGISCIYTELKDEGMKDIADGVILLSKGSS